MTKTTPVADGEVTASAITCGETLSKSTISGKMKDPVTDAEVEGTFGFSTKNGIDAAYQKDIPAFTDAGEHTLYYVVYDAVNWNYEYFKGEFTFTNGAYTVSGEVKGIDLTDSTRPGAPVPDAVVTIRSASGLTDGAIVGGLDDEAARRFTRSWR